MRIFGQVVSPPIARFFRFRLEEARHSVVGDRKAGGFVTKIWNGLRTGQTGRDEGLEANHSPAIATGKICRRPFIATVWAFWESTVVERGGAGGGRGTESAVSRA
jgi:hypothetical protein